MARDRDLLIKEYDDIHNRFNELFSEREFGVRKYTLEWVYAKVASEFYKTPKTVKGIITSPKPNPKEQNPNRSINTPDLIFQ